MKKRIASFLLAALLVLTAVPLVVFTATAEQTEEEEAVNYDDLYVKVGLSYQFDTFKTNPFWDPDGTAVVIPEELYAMADENGEKFFDTVESRVDQTFAEDGTTLTAVAMNKFFSEAVTAYKASWDAIFESFRYAGNRKLQTQLPAVGTKSHNDKTGSQQSVSFTLEDGYLQFKGSNGYNESKLGINGESYRGISSIQYVMAPGSQLGSNYYILYRGVSLSLTPGGDGGLVFKSGISYNGVDYGAPVTNGSIHPENVGDFTITVEHPDVTGTEERQKMNGRLVIRYNADKLVESSLSYSSASSDSVLQMSLLNFYKSSQAQLYAIRIYDRELTEKDIKLNHFADIAKYYKLNVDGYLNLTEAEKLELADLYADVTVGNHDEAFVEQLRVSVPEKIEDLIYGAIVKEDPISSGAFEFSELAKSLKLDISSVRALPIEYRQTVYSAVLGLVDRSKENVEAVIELTINEILEENFGDYIVEEAPITYKDLYVKQDHLKIWVDFFAAREEDGFVYDQFSYPDETMESEVAHQGNPDQPYNMDVLFQKYRFRGGDSGSKVNVFTFKKILPNEGTNIRAYGDGYLKTGPQNMIHILSPGNAEDMTYQFVAKVIGKAGGAGGSYTQLDGIRFTYGTDKNGNAYISAMQYHGFGTADSGKTLDSTNTTRLEAGKQVTFGAMNHSADMTITIDKDKNRPFVYQIGYITDAEGHNAYFAQLGTAPDVSNLTAVGTAGYYEYKTVGEEKLYVDKSGNLAWNNGSWQKHFYLVDKGDGNFAYCDGKGNEWITTTADKIYEDARTALGVIADNEDVSLVGPLYDNKKITEAPSGAVNSYGPYDLTTMSVSAYGNGNLLYKLDDLTYRNQQVGTYGSGADMDVYAVRTYDCVLTQEEIRQNHFADLAGYYGFDLSLYMILSDEQKTQLYDSLITMQLGDNRASCVANYEALLSDLLYSFDSESEAALSFRELCENYLLNVKSLFTLSVESQENVFESFADVNPTSLHYAAILQSRLEKAVEEELFNHYEAATIHKTIDFESWQLHVYGDPGFRAVFEINEQHLSTFIARSTTAKIGILIAEKGNKAGQISSLDGITLAVADDGSLILPDGVNATIAYENGQYTDAVMQENGKILFSEAILPDEESYAQKYYCVAFVVLHTAEEDIVYLQAAPYGNDNAPSLGEFSERALALNWAYPNVQTVLTKYLEDDGYNKVAGFIGNSVISDLRVSIESTEKKMIERVNPLLNFYFGVSMIEGDIDGNGIYIGKFDSVYDKNSYGVTVQNGNLYIWYNDDEQIDLVVDLLDEILAYHYNLGGDIILPNGFNEVRKVMGAQ